MELAWPEIYDAAHAPTNTAAGFGVHLNNAFRKAYALSILLLAFILPLPEAELSAEGMGEEEEVGGGGEGALR